MEEIEMHLLDIVTYFFLIGDYAKGIDSGVIEVVIEGGEIHHHYLEQLKEKIEKEIQKTILFQVTQRFEGDGLLVFEQV